MNSKEHKCRSCDDDCTCEYNLIECICCERCHSSPDANDWELEFEDEVTYWPI